MALASASASSSVSPSAVSPSRAGHDESCAIDAGEELDLMGTPNALAPATTQIPRHFTFVTPTAAKGDDAAGAAGLATPGEESTFRRLNFTTKECATPGRYDHARNKNALPLAVFCRIKPMLNQQQTQSQQPQEKENDGSAPEDVDMTDAGQKAIESSSSGPSSTIRIESDSSIVCTAPAESASFRHGETVAKFNFTRVFTPDATQEEVFTHAAQPLVKALYEGQSGLLFAYGITASGKTYTIQGTKEQPGVIPRIVADLFGRLMNAGESQPKFKVLASYLEIYNESINGQERGAAGGVPADAKHTAPTS